MSTVYFSAKHAFDERLKDVTAAASSDNKKVAIYGTGTQKLEVIVKDKGVRPDCVSGLINESSETDAFTMRDGDVKVRSYKVNEENIIENMGNATRDELNLFMSLANPKILNDRDVQSSFFDRVSKIQERDFFEAAVGHRSSEGLEEAHMEETAGYTEFYSKVQGAVEVPEYHVFYPQGYVKSEPVITPEQ